VVKIDEETRSARKERICLLLAQYPNGLREVEIAELLGLEKRTVNNYLRELDTDGRIYKDEHQPIWLFDTPLGPRKLDLGPEQAGMLYLAIRMFVKQSDKRIETAETLLHRLAAILSEDMQVSSNLLEAAQELSERPHNPDYEDVFRVIIRAYIRKRQVRILYHPYRGEPFETILSPYLIEPSAIGFATCGTGKPPAIRLAACSDSQNSLGRGAARRPSSVGEIRLQTRLFTRCAIELG
jgi:predicted DNA-binding transcriptional regulator YafY